MVINQKVRHLLQLQSVGRILQRKNEQGAPITLLIQDRKLIYERNFSIIFLIPNVCVCVCAILSMLQFCFSHEDQMKSSFNIFHLCD